MQGDRIAAAACFLPLSVNPKVSRQLGTRHRAALGLTEENDAVAVVVSEETGTISIAINGRLERDFTQETLRLRLGALLGVRRNRYAPTLAGPEHGRLMPLRRARRIGLMLVSLVLAAGLWLLVAGEQTVERTMRIPLEFTNLPAHLELAGDAPDTVDVRVRGASASLSRLTTGDLMAVLDLRQAKPGQRLFHLQGADVRAPLSVEIVQVQPSSVAMTFETSETKIVPVSPRVEGQPAAGFRIGAISQPAGDGGGGGTRRRRFAG